MSKPSASIVPFGASLPGGSVPTDINWFNRVGGAYGPIIDAHDHSANNYGAQIDYSSLSINTVTQLPPATTLSGATLDTLLGAITGKLAELQSGDHTADWTASAGTLAQLNPLSALSGHLNLDIGSTVTAGIHESLVTDGTAPLIINSSTQVDGLNVELVGGIKATVSYGIQQPSTIIYVGSNGVSLPHSTIQVNDASSFDTSGTILVTTAAGTQTVTYTGIAEDGSTNFWTFSGCSGGTGAMSTGGAVVANDFPSGKLLAMNTDGLYDHYAIAADPSPSTDRIDAPVTIADDLANIRASHADISEAAGLTGFYDDMPTSLVTSLSVNDSLIPPGDLFYADGPGLTSIVTDHTWMLTPNVQGFSLSGTVLDPGIVDLIPGTNVSITPSGNSLVIASTGTGGGGGGLTDDGLVLTGGATHIPLTSAPSAGFSNLYMVPSASTGPPSSGTHTTGEYMVDVNGILWGAVKTGTGQTPQFKSFNTAQFYFLDYIVKYGGDSVGVTDCTTAWNQMTADFQAAGGGDIVVGPGTYKILGQAQFFNSKVTSPTVPATTATSSVGATQSSGRLRGAGSGWAWSYAPQGGTVFDLRYDGTTGDAWLYDLAHVSGLAVTKHDSTHVDISAGTAYHENTDSTSGSLLSWSAKSNVACTISGGSTSAPALYFVDYDGTTVTVNQHSLWTTNSMRLAELIVVSGAIVDIVPWHGRLGCMETRGVGHLQIENCAFADLSTGTSYIDVPLFKTTMTTVNFNNVYFYCATGASRLNGYKGRRDGIHWGGPGTTIVNDPTDAAPTAVAGETQTASSCWSGYASGGQNMYFDGVARAMYLKTQSNNMRFRNLWTWGATGNPGGAAIQIDSVSPTVGGGSIQFVNCVIESQAYTYGIVANRNIKNLKYENVSVIDGVQCFLKTNTVIGDDHIWIGPTTGGVASNNITQFIGAVVAIDGGTGQGQTGTFSSGAGEILQLSASAAILGTDYGTPITATGTIGTTQITCGSSAQAAQLTSGKKFLFGSTAANQEWVTSSGQVASSAVVNVSTLLFDHTGTPQPVYDGTQAFKLTVTGSTMYAVSTGALTVSSTVQAVHSSSGGNSTRVAYTAACFYEGQYSGSIDDGPNTIPTSVTGTFPYWDIKYATALETTNHRYVTGQGSYRVTSTPTFVNGLTSNGTINSSALTASRLASTCSTAPTLAYGSAAGSSPPSSPTLTTGSNDVCGQVLFGTGTATTTGQLVTITFGNASLHSNNFVVLVSWGSAGPDGGASLFTGITSHTAFSIGTNHALAISQSATHYAINYWVIDVS